MSVFSEYKEKMGKLIGTIGDPLQAIFEAAGNAVGGVAGAMGLGLDKGLTAVADGRTQNSSQRPENKSPEEENIAPATRSTSPQDIAPDKQKQYAQLLQQNGMNPTGELPAQQVTDPTINFAQNNALRVSGPTAQRAPEQQVADV